MGPRWRKKSPDKVAEELEVMQKENGIQMAFFTDAIFNTPPDYAEAICRAIVDRGVKIGWMATLHPAFAERPLVELMQAAGCVAVGLASDACSERMLKNLRKDISKDDLRSTAEMLEEMGINYVINLLIGGPGETRETVDESIDFLKQRKPLFASFCIGIRLMPLPRFLILPLRRALFVPTIPLWFRNSTSVPTSGIGSRTTSKTSAPLVRIGRSLTGSKGASSHRTLYYVSDSATDQLPPGVDLKRFGVIPQFTE